MGIAGHKHHFDNQRIEKEMKNIGDAVRFRHSGRFSSMNCSFFKDPLTKLKELCGDDHGCAHLKQRLQECNDRVNSKPWTKETCNEELLDFLHCVDECVMKTEKKIIRILFFFRFSGPRISSNIPNRTLNEYFLVVDISVHN